MGVYILSRNLLKMTDSQTHLKSAIEQRNNIVKEIEEYMNCPFSLNRRENESTAD